jgi:hypothetical protein
MSDSRVFVAVPERLVGRLRENVELLIGVTAEALSCTLRARASDEEAAEHRQRLLDLAELLVRLAPDGPGEVLIEGEVDVIHDAAHGALLDAGERVAATVNGSVIEAADVRGTTEEVVALERLMRRVKALVA